MLKNISCFSENKSLPEKIFSLITGKNSLLISYPIEFLFVIDAASEVVPLPRNGSSTVSPKKVNISISLFGISTGNIAGCLSCLTPGNFQWPEKYSFHFSLSLLKQMENCLIS